MAWKCISFIVDYWLYISLVHIITLDGSSCNILSITRSSDIGDSFEMQLENETDSVCQKSSCEQFGGFLHKANQGRSHSKCSCYCGNSTKPTFYSTKSGKQICVNDIEVLKGANGGMKTIDFVAVVVVLKVNSQSSYILILNCRYTYSATSFLSQ